jgi:PHP family Zn ribbon phosphoesterase
MKFYADFNIHSKYSRGAHPDMEIPTLAKWAKIKGLGLLGTGDFTQPQWLVELKKFLKPSSGRGIYEYDGARFLLTSELVCVYTKAGRPKKINHLLFAPHFSAVDKIVDALERHGNLETEARPSVKLSAPELVEAVREAAPEALVAPAHAWGLAHSLFSPVFGFDSLEEAYGSVAGAVPVLETGLCCDPALARRSGAAIGRTLISSSDAHHPSHLGREAAVFDAALDYRDIVQALGANDRKRFRGTVESFPEEDRHHLAGHRSCRRRRPPEEAAPVCGVCGKPFSAGVLERVAALGARGPADGPPDPHVKILPLGDVIADALGYQPDAETVQREYAAATAKGPELDILIDWPAEKLWENLPARVAAGVLALRRGEVTADPGYDGQPGRVRVIIPAEVNP